MKHAQRLSGGNIMATSPPSAVGSQLLANSAFRKSEPLLDVFQITAMLEANVTEEQIVAKGVEHACAGLNERFRARRPETAERIVEGLRIAATRVKVHNKLISSIKTTHCGAI